MFSPKVYYGVNCIGIRQIPSSWSQHRSQVQCSVSVPLVHRCGLLSLLYFSTVDAVVVAAGLNVRSVGHKMHSDRNMVKHGSYQLSLSEGLTESDRSAVHQYATLFSHLTVTALRPVKRRSRRRQTKRKEEPAKSKVSRENTEVVEWSKNAFPYQTAGSSSAWMLESKSSRSTACLLWRSTIGTHAHS